jgi:hypothetical protein
MVKGDISLSKHNDVWGDPYELEEGAVHLPNNWKIAPDEDIAKYLDEAHEALSRLYNKTHKRKKVNKSQRRGESWQ